MTSRSREIRDSFPRIEYFNLKMDAPKCFSARDAYFKCVDAKIDQSECNTEAAQFEQFCSEQWRSFFMEQHRKENIRRIHQVEAVGAKDHKVDQSPSYGTMYP